MADQFIIEFNRGAGVGGSKLQGALVVYTPRKSAKARKVAEFRFIGHSALTYEFDITTGLPTKAKYLGKFSIAQQELEGLPLRLELFAKNERCCVCKGPAFNRPSGKPIPKQIQVKGKFEWCCGGCRQPELVR